MKAIFAKFLGQQVHSVHYYVRGVTPSVASKANDIKKSVFTKKGPKYSLGFML